MCRGYRLAGRLERREGGLLERELSVDHDAERNAQKIDEDETAIKNNDESVDKPELEIKDVNIRIVFNVSDPRAKT